MYILNEYIFRNMLFDCNSAQTVAAAVLLIQRISARTTLTDICFGYCSQVDELLEKRSTVPMLSDSSQAAVHKVSFNGFSYRFSAKLIQGGKRTCVGYKEIF